MVLLLLFVAVCKANCLIVNFLVLLFGVFFFVLFGIIPFPEKVRTYLLVAVSNGEVPRSARRPSTCSRCAYFLMSVIILVVILVVVFFVLLNTVVVVVAALVVLLVLLVLVLVLDLDLDLVLLVVIVVDDLFLQCPLQ